MCRYCEGIKRAFPDYLYCPMCGSLYNEDGFIPLYMMEKKVSRDSQGRLIGLPVESFVKIK